VLVTCFLLPRNASRRRRCRGSCPTARHFWVPHLFASQNLSCRRAPLRRAELSAKPLLFCISLYFGSAVVAKELPADLCIYTANEASGMFFSYRLQTREIDKRTVSISDQIRWRFAFRPGNPRCWPDPRSEGNYSLSKNACRVRSNTQCAEHCRDQSAVDQVPLKGPVRMRGVAGLSNLAPG
jgi:hypothetical protein